MPLVGLGQGMLSIFGVVVDVRDAGGHARACSVGCVKGGV